MRWLRQLRTRQRAARELRERAAAIYGEVVAAAREPAIYRNWRVPDTVDGRFEMLALHVLLRARALRQQAGEGATLAQALVDSFFADLDRNLREMGVGDLSMGRRMKGLAATWLARARDLEAALDARDAEAIAAMLRRNLGPAGAETDCLGLAAAVLACAGEAARPPAAAAGPPAQDAARSPNSTRSR